MVQTRVDRDTGTGTQERINPGWRGHGNPRIQDRRYTERCPGEHKTNLTWEHWSARTQEEWTPGTQEHRNTVIQPGGGRGGTGTYVHGNTGAQEHRNTGTQEHSTIFSVRRHTHSNMRVKLLNAITTRPYPTRCVIVQQHVLFTRRM